MSIPQSGLSLVVEASNLNTPAPFEECRAKGDAHVLEAPTRNPGPYMKQSGEGSGVAFGEVYA